MSSVGDFSAGRENFSAYLFNSNTDSVSWVEEANFVIAAATTEVWHVQLQHAASLRSGQAYVLCFDAKADAAKTISANVDAGEPDYTSLSGAQDFALTTSYARFSFPFVASATDATARVTFNLGGANPADVQLDNIGLYEGSVCGGTSSGSSSSGSSSASSSTSSSSSSASSSTSSGGTGIRLGSTVEAETFNPAKSYKAKIETDSANANNKWVGFFDSGSFYCFDNVDLTGVRSIEFRYATAYALPSRLGFFLDDPAIPLVKNKFFDVERERNIGEIITEGSGGWTTFKTMRMGLNQEVTGTHTLCLVGVIGAGIANVDRFTLSSQPGNHDGITRFGYKTNLTVQPVAPITVVGNQVRFGGAAGSIAGMSYYWSGSSQPGGEYYYNAGTVKYFRDNWKAKLVRAAIAVEELNGIVADYMGNRQHAINLVEAALENGMYVIIDWHTHHAEDYESEAIAFFTEMATRFGQHPHVIYEIYNEPLAVSWSGTIKPYAQRVINAIRAIDPDNLIVVGTPNWSQDVDVASRDRITGTNIAYTLHFYAGSHRDSLRAKAQTALSNGAALFVTEWGSVNADGNGTPDAASTQAWMTFLKTNNISHANWAVSAFEGSSILKTGTGYDGNWSSSDLTPAGELVRNIIQNW